jgi:hypothetical protein
LLQRRGGEAGRVPLVAHDHDLAVVVGRLGDPVRRGRVESPLEHVAIDDDGAGHLPVALALRDRSDVDHERAPLQQRR